MSKDNLKKDGGNQAEGQTTADSDKKMRIIWDDSKMQSSYANVCNVSSTKEEFNLLFGTNQSWAGLQQNVRIALDHRIILNPHAAKRMAIMLNQAIQRYEEKMGKIDLLSDVTPSVDETSSH